jgi:hypothetical protein
MRSTAMTSLYVGLGLLALLAWGIRGAIRWWNLPAVAAARASRAIERQRQRTERLKIRRERGLFGFRRGSQLSSGRDQAGDEHV